MNPYLPPQADVDTLPLPPARTAELAGRGARLAAQLVDTVLSLIIVLPTQFMLGFYDRQVSLAENLLWSVGGFALWCTLHGALLINGGQTIGKRLLGIRVVTLDGDQAVGFARYALSRELPIQMLAIPMILTERFVPLVVLAVPLSNLVWGMIGLADILLIFRDDRRCAHDLIAGTRVVRAR